VLYSYDGKYTMNYNNAQHGNVYWYLTNYKPYNPCDTKFENKSMVLEGGNVLLAIVVILCEKSMS
jgi:hypothetical protein